ncbi:hypothetical protein FIBSPDRAFT_957967 [Athelia psychrophila]|uniref:Uncharacterized protein n=1 Tax=Athelia psychrophila TaxID=1759441 RepID=A0A166F3B6_9AGAM|nr:hypothetical protein FIBSPDRAFT_957967 [Fibularhizoctonia sp. CBS 109695]
MGGALQVDNIDVGLVMKKQPPSEIYTIDGFTVSATTIRPFLFGSLTLTDDDAFLDTKIPTTVISDRLGPEKTTEARIEDAEVQFLDENPIVTFTFRYRPHDVLQANGILPIQVDKKRKAVDVPKEELLSEDELEESDATRDARIKASEDELRTLRSKPSGSGKSKAKRVKVESLIPEGFVSGEVIDLT